MTRFLALFGAASILLVSCGQKQKTDGATSAPVPKGATVLAKVNGETLTLEDLKLQLPAEYRDQLAGKDLQDAVDTWVNTVLLAQMGEKMGIDKSPEIAAVMRFRRADAIARRLVELEVTNKTLVMPAEVDSAYNADKAQYTVDKDRFRASHIVLGSQAEAEGVYNRLKKGDDFAKLAQEYSTDKQTSSTGGDLNYFTADQANQFDPAFGKAVLSLKVGEYSEPVQTAYGFHIIKLTDIMRAGTSLDSVEVKGRISDQLKTAKQGLAFSQLIDSLKAKAKIERFPAPGLDLQAVPDTAGK